MRPVQSTLSATSTAGLSRARRQPRPADTPLVGVATPSVLFCDPRGPLFLPEEWPTEWGCCFAIKPLYGFNDMAVMLIEHGIDRFTGARLRGREDVLTHLRQSNVPQLHRSTIYIETIIRPEEGLYSPTATPPERRTVRRYGGCGRAANCYAAGAAPRRLPARGRNCGNPDCLCRSSIWLCPNVKRAHCAGSLPDRNCLRCGQR